MRSLATRVALVEKALRHVTLNPERAIEYVTVPEKPKKAVLDPRLSPGWGDMDEVMYERVHEVDHAAHARTGHEHKHIVVDYGFALRHKPLWREVLEAEGYTFSFAHGLTAMIPTMQEVRP